MHTDPFPDLVVALDFSSGSLADDWLARHYDGIRAASRSPLILKVGLELFSAAGPRWVEKLVASGKRVFLDLKLHDIPNTVGKAALQAARLGVSEMTIHLSGGRGMADAARKQVEQAAHGSAGRTKILGVSVLTSFSEADWAATSQAISGVPSATADSVQRLAKLAQEWGTIDGIVSSPQELKRVRDSAPKLRTVVPGIRPAGSAVSGDDQSRTMAPREAWKNGAAAIVVGRPIIQAADPVAAAASIWEDFQ